MLVDIQQQPQPAGISHDKERGKELRGIGQHLIRTNLLSRIDVFLDDDSIERCFEHEELIDRIGRVAIKCQTGFRTLFFRSSTGEICFCGLQVLLGNSSMIKQFADAADIAFGLDVIGGRFARIRLRLAKIRRGNQSKRVALFEPLSGLSENAADPARKRAVDADRNIVIPNKPTIEPQSCGGLWQYRFDSNRGKLRAARREDELVVLDSRFGSLFGFLFSRLASCQQRQPSSENNHRHGFHTILSGR